MEQPVRYQRIKVRISAAGWLYIALTLVIGAAAVNTANNLLYLLTAALLGLMALSGIAAYRALRQLRLEIVLPREWYAGRAETVGVKVQNLRRLLPTFLLRLEGSEDATVLMEIPAQGAAAGSLSFRFPERGSAELGSITITSNFPFGFFTRGGTVRLEGEVMVYPRPIPVAQPRSGGPSSAQGTRPSRRPGVGGDYRGSRAYQPGDPLTRIDWKTWARSGDLVVKEFEEEETPPIVLSLDDVDGRTLDEKLGKLTWLVLEAHQAGQPVGLELPGNHQSADLGEAARHRQLRALAVCGARDAHTEGVRP